MYWVTAHGMSGGEEGREPRLNVSSFDPTGRVFTRQVPYSLCMVTTDPQTWGPKNEVETVMDGCQDT